MENQSHSAWCILESSLVELWLRQGSAVKGHSKEVSSFLRAGKVVMIGEFGVLET